MTHLIPTDYIEIYIPEEEREKTFLTKFQERALYIFMEIFGTEAGICALYLYDNTFLSFGESILTAAKIERT